MKKSTLVLVLVLLLSLFTGCASRSFSPGYDSSSKSYAGGGVAYYAAAEGYADDYMYEVAEEAEFEPSYGAETADLSVPASAGAQDVGKLIYTAELEMETLEFEAAVQALTKLTSEAGGYFESSSVSDTGYYRRASFTVRVPAESYRAFLEGAAGEECHVLSQQEYTEDVSEAYYDVSGRLDTQKTKLGRLQELMAEAEDMEDIILLESAISETEELIDRLSGTLRHYDALADYSTVTVSLREVKVYEPEPDPTYGTRLGTAFREGLSDFGRGMGNILVTLAYSWLWLVLIAVVVVLILWLTRKRRADRRQERAARKAARRARVNEPAVYSTPAEDGSKPEE